MGFPVGVTLEEAMEIVWGQMTMMREYGFEQLEGDLHMEGEVLQAEVRGIAPKPTEHITLTFHVENS